MGIETSCDETAVALLRDGHLLADVVASQTDIHSRYGGVVPELASRRHIEVILPVMDDALSKAGLSLSQVDGIAATYRPGLAGALLVGLSFGKALSLSLGVPFVGVSHLEGHLLSIFLEEELPFPYLGLVVSGGHTNLYIVEGFGRYTILGSTLDDAAGEAFDKVAKVLGLGYPGGRIIDELAGAGDPGAVEFPRAWLPDRPFHFSFSGLKTAVAYYLRKRGSIPEGKELYHIAASFQEAVVDVLTGKCLQVACQFGLKRLVVTGGVAANRRLRVRLKEEFAPFGSLHIPSPRLCTDNGAMIAYAGYQRLKRGLSSPLDLNADPSAEM